MILNKKMYVPVLGWRQSEYQALLQLNTSVKSKIVPLILIPKIGLKSDTKQEIKTVDQHVRPFIKQYNIKWGVQPAWVTLHDKITMGRMDDGSHVLDYIFDGLRPYNSHVAPAVAISSDSDTIAAASRAINQDKYGAAIIVRIEDLMTDHLINKVTNLSNNFLLPLNQIDLIIDLRAPNFKPYHTFSRALINAMNRLGDLSLFRNLVIVSTAIFKNSRNIAKGIDEIPRHDWLFYKTLLATLPNGTRYPVYGDYTVVHPEFTFMDMRMIKPAGKIVYTTEESWVTCKGGAFRDNPRQMHDHCKTIVNNHRFQFRGANFSFGDDYIAECAEQRKSPSNLGMWKRITINHHITTVVDNLAKMYAPS